MTFKFEVGQRYTRRDGDSTRIIEVTPFFPGTPDWIAVRYIARTSDGYYVTTEGRTHISNEVECYTDLIELLTPEKQVTTEPGPAPTPEVRDALVGGGLKYDGSKPAMGLVSPLAQMEEGLALLYGAKKYDKHNYLKGLTASQILGAQMRHTLLLMVGDETDEESGIHHVGHIRANTAMYRDCQAQGTLVDDRPYNETYRKTVAALLASLPTLIKGWEDQFAVTKRSGK